MKPKQKSSQDPKSIARAIAGDFKNELGELPKSLVGEAMGTPNTSVAEAMQQGGETPASTDNKPPEGVGTLDYLEKEIEALRARKEQQEQQKKAVEEQEAFQKEQAQQQEVIVAPAGKSKPKGGGKPGQKSSTGESLRKTN